MTIKALAKIKRHKVANASIQVCPACDRIYPCNATRCDCMSLQRGIYVQGTDLQPVVMVPSAPEYCPAGN